MLLIIDYLPISCGKSKILVLYRVIPLYCKQLIEKELCKRRAFLTLTPFSEPFSPPYSSMFYFSYFGMRTFDLRLLH